MTVPSGWRKAASSDETTAGGGRLTERRATRVGGRDASFRAWQVRCGTDVEFVEFIVRLWWPAAELTLWTQGHDEAYDSTVAGIVASVILPAPS